MRATTVAVGLGVVLLVASCGGESSPTAEWRAAATPAVSVPAFDGQPVAIARTERQICTLAQDGDRLVWIEATDRRGLACAGSEAEPPEEILVTQLVGRESTRRVLARGIFDAGTLVLAGDRVLWSQGPTGAPTTYQYVYTMAVGDRRPTSLEGDGGLMTTEAEGGEWLTDVAGDGQLLVYAGAAHEYACWADSDMEECREEWRAWTWAKRVVGGEARDLRGVDGGVIAAADPNIVSAALTEGERVDVGVHNGVTGERLASLRVPAGVGVMGLALTREYVVMLVVEQAQRMIALSDANSGAFVRNIIPVRTPDEQSISASERGILYTAGNDLRLINPSTFTDQRLARVAPGEHGPPSASIEGSRVIWAETAGSGSRIRAITVAG